MSDLRIRANKAVEEIGKSLVALVGSQKTDGVILGLSGGLDSSVLAALAVRALGSECVSVVYLHDRDSDQTIAGNARLVASALKLDLETFDITEEMAKGGTYKPAFIQLLRISPLVARLSTRIYRTVCGESPFKSTLRVGRGEVLSPWYKRLLFDLTMRHVDSGFSQRHCFRRSVLERLAKQRNLTLVGAANRSECEVGWFVKDGVDDLPFQPMTGLFKTQVRQLAEMLALPGPVRTQAPSPDMAKGVTDEFGIGHQYRDVDIVIDAIDRAAPEAEIIELGIAKEEIADIRDLMALSDWKRTSPHQEPPVSGRFGSEMRY